MFDLFLILCLIACVGAALLLPTLAAYKLIRLLGRCLFGRRRYADLQ